MDKKPGATTTEFWMTMAFHAAGMVLILLQKVDAQWAFGAMAGAQSVYSWTRGHVKGMGK